MLWGNSQGGALVTAARRTSLCAALAAAVALAACGSQPAAAPPSSAAPASPAAAKPAASAAAASAAAKPAASASAKPAASGSASAVAKPSGQTKLTLGYSNVTGNSLPTWSAGEGGFYTRNGLDVDLQFLAGGTKTMAALIAGQLQVAEVGGGETLGAVAEGADLVVFATVSPVYPYKFMVAPAIQKPEDLKGKKLGIASQGGSADIAGRVVMRKFGIDPDKDVSTIVLGDSATRYAALLNGAIDAAMADPPSNLEIQAKGFRVLFDLAELKLPASQTVQVAQRSWLNANKAVVQAIVDSEVQSTARAKKDKPFTDAIFRKYFKLDDQAALDEIYKFYAQGVAPSLPYPKAEQFNDTVDQLSVRNPHVKDVQLSKILDESFVKSAADRGLDKG